MQQKETGKKQSRSISLPEISPVLRIVLFIGIFLIVAIPLFFIYVQQQARQTELNQQYFVLEKALGKSEPLEALTKRLAGDLQIVRNDLDNSNLVFPKIDQLPEITDRLLGLAKSNSLTLTKMQITTVKNTIDVAPDILEYPVVVFDINLRGQMPRFQNFLLDLNGKFPTAEVKTMSFKLPEIEEEEDTANMVLYIYGNKVIERTGGEIEIAGKKPLASFSGKKDLTTDIVKVKGARWRIDWKFTAEESNVAGLTLIVYRKGETMRYVDIFYHVGGSPRGTDYVYRGEGDYYLRIITGNIASWDIKVYE